MVLIRFSLYPVYVSNKLAGMFIQTFFWLCRASRLGREHHDDLAQFMLGMGYATEALHLPGISKR